jgi:hypothetical protein
MECEAFHISPTEGEVEAYISLIESIEDLDLFSSPEHAPILPAFNTQWRVSRREDYSQAEARKLAAVLQSRGFEASERVSLPFGDLYAWEIMAEFYGFAEHRKQLMGGPQSTRFPDYSSNSNSDIRALSGHRRPDGKFFDVSAIGPQRYNAVKVAISKALARLEERDLILRLWWDKSLGMKLTDSGFDLSSSLSANTNDNVISVSQ